MGGVGACSSARSRDLSSWVMFKKKNIEKHEKQCAVTFHNGLHHLPMIPQEKRAVPWLMVDGSRCGKKTSSLENEVEIHRLAPEPLHVGVLRRNHTMPESDL